MKAILVLALCAAVAVSAFEVEVEMDEAPQKKPARVVGNPLMRNKDVIIVPKGDPRARAPPVDAIKIDTSVPAGQWTSPVVELARVLQASTGAYCTASPTNIRSQPTTTGSILLTTTAGERVQITATTERAANGYTWIPVSARGKSGWIVKTLVAVCPSATPPQSTSRTFPLFKQCGQSWSNAFLGTCKKTTCSIGCAVSSVAMILKARGVDTDPGRLNAWLTNNGGFANGCSIYWAKVDALGKTRCQGFQNASFATLCSWVAAGKGVVINVNNGGHWVLATGCDVGSNSVRVNDPGYAKTTYPFSAISRQVVYN